ncbi:MAG: hypothetical protein ABSH06_09975 [Thermodesulfobacteriota bacterium]
MEEKDRKGFIVLMLMLSEAFKEDMSTERVKIYFEFLKPYSLYQVMQAVNHLIRHSKFFPRVADFHELIDPEDGYHLFESEEAKKLRLKNEEKIMLEYVGDISKLLGRKKDSGPKQLSYKDN